MSIEQLKITTEAKRALYSVKEYNETYSDAIIKIVKFYKENKEK
ncbi:MAG: hypothetical protein ACFFCZ_01610 [Promethearchaeota archaeon]